MRNVAPFCVAYGMTAAVFLPARAGTAVRTGREAGFWTDWHRALVIARVRETAAHVERAESPFYMHMAIEPLATPAGTFDPSEHAQLDVQFYVGTPSIPEAPTEGDVVMIVIEDGHFIVSDKCQFMPHDLPLFVIDGLGDAHVHDALKARKRGARKRGLGKGVISHYATS